MEQIVRVKQTHENGMATVLVQRESACSGDCHKCSGCGAAKEFVVLEAVNHIGAEKGDLVVIQSETGPVMKAVGVFYVLPLVLFFLGYYLGHTLWGLGPLVGCLGFALSFGLAIAYDRLVARRQKSVPTITAYAGDAILKSMKKGDNCHD